MDLTQDEDNDIFGNIDLPAARAETAATLDPPEIGVHAPPLQETVANEEELEDPSAPQRSNGPENGVKEKPPPKFEAFEAFEAESPNQEDPIIPDALPGPSSNKKTKIEEIENENQQLKEAQNCKICMDNKVAVVFLPCRHLISCVSCAQQLRDCPNCRKFIQGKIKTFS